MTDETFEPGVAGNRAKQVIHMVIRACMFAYTYLNM